MARKPALNVIAWISASFGVATGLLMLLIAVEHNPQGALIDHDTGALDFPYALLLFSLWFLVGSIFIGLAISAVSWAVARTRSR
jgi:hypothetical protein